MPTSKEAEEFLELLRLIGAEPKYVVIFPFTDEQVAVERDYIVLKDQLANPDVRKSLGLGGIVPKEEKKKC